ncbi:MAG: MBL fold metallo-hydrolase [bacterium]|nr:MBL fold metallo-hydrolase [bacterium]
MCITACGADDVCELVFLNVGYGAATLVRHADTTLLIDGGDDGGQTDQGTRTVIPLLRANKIATLDAIICTHAHDDHCGGLINVLAQVPTRAMYRPTWRATNAYTSAVDALVARQKIPLTILARGMTCAWGRLQLHVLNPPAGGADVMPAPVDLNAASLGLELVFGAARALLLAGRTNWPAAVLQIPHHGAVDAFTPQLLAAVAPQHAILSVGANPYGYPSPGIVPAYSARTQLWRTDRDGTILCGLSTDGTLRVTCVPAPTR